jgi:hypothetical protein
MQPEAFDVLIPLCSVGQREYVRGTDGVASLCRAAIMPRRTSTNRIEVLICTFMQAATTNGRSCTLRRTARVPTPSPVHVCVVERNRLTSRYLAECSKCWCTKSVFVSHAVRTSRFRTSGAQAKIDPLRSIPHLCRDDQQPAKVCLPCEGY